MFENCLLNAEELPEWRTALEERCLGVFGDKARCSEQQN